MDLLKNFGLLGVALVFALVGMYLGSTGAKGYDMMAFLTGAVFFCAQIIVANNRMGVLATSVLAAGANGYLLYSKFASSGYTACKVDAYWDCAKVNSLPESELFGVPVTLLGVGFYVGLAFASLGNQERTPRFDQINGLFAIPSLLFSAWLGWVAFQAKAGCIMCITIYACNVLLLWAAIKGLKAHGRTLFEGVDKVFGTSTLWVITATFALITLVGTSAWRSRQAESEMPSGDAATDIAQLRELYTRPQGTIKLDGTEPRYGKRDAPIRIVEFADYGCPHCAQASPMLKQIVDEHPEVQLLFKAFPLSGACNPAIPGTDGVERCKSAMAAECAGAQGRYFEMSSVMFKNLGYNSDDDLAYMAKDIGLDFEAWVNCMQDPATQDAVRADAMAGIDAQVQGTPTLFVSGLAKGDWIEITRGPPALLTLLEATQKGTELPAP